MAAYLIPFVRSRCVCVGIESSQLSVSVCVFGCGCSTYLVQKRLDMLPKILTETLCSLTGKAEHFAFR